MIQIINSLWLGNHFSVVWLLFRQHEELSQLNTEHASNKCHNYFSSPRSKILVWNLRICHYMVERVCFNWANFILLPEHTRKWVPVHSLHGSDMMWESLRCHAFYKWNFITCLEGKCNTITMKSCINSFSSMLHSPLMAHHAMGAQNTPIYAWFDMPWYRGTWLRYVSKYNVMTQYQSINKSKIHQIK